VSLNNLGIGDFDLIRKRIEEARSQVLASGHEELAERLDQAALALERGQLAEYRRLLSFVVSRLGHLRD
jgi:cobalamin biosynthesis protein CobD/CbiB